MIMDICKKHANQKIVYICLNDDPCKKTLCEICYQSHQQMPSQLSRIIKIELFKHLLNLAKVEKEFIQALVLKQNFDKLNLELIIGQVKSFFEELNINQTNQIDFNDYLNYTEDDFNLKIKNMPEFKKTILMLINQILISQQEIFKMKNEIDIRNMIFSTYQEDYNHIRFYGSTIFGFRHGQQITIIDGVQKQAQTIYLNQRIGQWREYGIKKKNYQKQMSIEIQCDKGKISYIKDGQILKQINSTDKVDLENVVQIKCMNWSGQYQNGKKFGKWHIYWRGQNLGIGGDYNQNGVKDGFWIEVSKNFCNDAQVYFKGQYQEGIKVGLWSIDYHEYCSQWSIGCGQYDNDGIKQGQWLELHEKFSNQFQFLYVGQYQEGAKRGFWAIKQKLRYNKAMQKIKEYIARGGGFYNQKGMKSGSWIELNEMFSDQAVIQIGDYQNGKRIGLWCSNKPFQYNCFFWEFQENNNNNNVKIREKGKYNEQGQKSGKWVEYQQFLKSKEYDFELEQSYIACKGDYKDGVKFGLWDILVDCKDNPSKFKGFGVFDKKGLKNGLWIQLDKNYKEHDEIVFFGQYQNGKKIHFWQTKYENQVGGGYYGLDGKKYGKWKIMKLLSGRENLLTQYTGLYFDGRKNGKWNQYYYYDHFGRGLECGGEYDNLGMKTGRWKEVKNNDTEGCEVVHEGEYQKGFRIGRWDIFDIFQIKKLGGGMYLEGGIKDGIWTELDLNFIYRVERNCEGLYQNGVKIGPWKLNKKELKELEYKQIGICWYNNLGIKVDQQMEVSKKGQLYIDRSSIGLLAREQQRNINEEKNY